MRKERPYLTVLAASLLLFGTAQAQNPAQLAQQAAELSRSYDFPAAISLLEQARDLADSASRTEFESLLWDARNAENMSGFCSRPVAVARKRVALKDFHLYFPLQDKAWRQTPNQLDTLGGPEAPAVYVPENAAGIYFSARDAEGVRNIYTTTLADTVWTAPALPGPAFESSGNEIFPMLSFDGKALFFASDGLYGMGGYDLYVSRWDEEASQWSAPENLGFPYSSPYNDYMFINSEDGRYSVFASDRDCPADSVCIYVVEFDAMPVRESISSPERLRELSALVPGGKSGSGTAMDSQVANYMEAYEKVESLKAEIEAGGALDDSLQESLSNAKTRLQELEMDLLLAGKSVEPEKLRSTATASTGGTISLSRHGYGAPLKLDILSPEPTFDYTLQILDEGRFAEDNTIPDGLVYQVQMISLSKQATVQQLKGVSPVFYRKGSSGYIVHYAGVFRTYDEAQKGLAIVKKAGFPRAFIKAFNDGKELTVQKARELEKQDVSTYQIRIVTSDGKSLTDNERTVISAVADKDLARIVEDGVTIYLFGPFESRREAELALTGLKAGGLTEVELEEIEKQ